MEGGGGGGGKDARERIMEGGRGRRRKCNFSKLGGVANGRGYNYYAVLH